jgi:hypothetical protein
MFPAARRIVVIGDVHGDSERLVKALQVARVFSPNLEWIAEPADTMVVQMGDQLDSLSRTPVETEWETRSDVSLMELMDNLDTIAKQKGGRVISLIGNHEMMNMAGEFVYVSKLSFAESGGADTRRREFLPGGKYHKMLMNRYVIVKIGTYLFCHAGILPSHLNTVGENIQEFNTAFWALSDVSKMTQKHKFLLDNVLFPINGFLWTRKYAEMLDKPDLMKIHLSIVLQTTKSTTMFIGHNTMQSIFIAGDGGIVFTDACFSRAYGGDSFQFVDIRDGVMNIVQVSEKVTSI